MKEKITSASLKMGLVLFFINLVMLFMTSPNSPERIISYVTTAILLCFNVFLIIRIRLDLKKEHNDENK